MFFARKRELKILNHAFADVTLPEKPGARLCFIAGDAGAGKTTLVKRFIEQLRKNRQGAPPIAAIGHCNPLIGPGDPYMPCRQALEALIKQAAEGGGGFKGVLKTTTQALISNAPDLLGNFIPCSTLLTRMAVDVARKEGWLDVFEKNQSVFENKEGQLNRNKICKQFTATLQGLGQSRPVVLCIEDLQWADAASLYLLSRLAEDLQDGRVLLIVTYRPSDLPAGQSSQGAMVRHLISSVKNESINLNETDDRESFEFVSELLDATPNLLDEEFRNRFQSLTRGHPLYAVELLDHMRNREDLVKDDRGRWVTGPAIDWNSLPAQTGELIVERIERLNEHERDMLHIASVEGATFTAELVAKVDGKGVRETVRNLYRNLQKRHNLVCEEKVERHGLSWLTRYSFSHGFFQQYLYNDLSARERMFLHADIAQNLEELYPDRLDDIALQLGYHYQRAGDPLKAILHLCCAAEGNTRLAAYDQARTHLNMAFRLLDKLAPEEEPARQELALQTALINVLQANAGFASKELGARYDRALSLSRELGELKSRAAILFGQWTFSMMIPDFEKSFAVAGELSELAGETGAPSDHITAGLVFGNTHFWRGDFESAHRHIREALKHFDPADMEKDTEVTGHDNRVLVLMFHALLQSLTGERAEAVETTENLLLLSRTLDHPFTLAIALQAGAWVYQHMGDPDLVLKYAGQLVDLTVRLDIPFYRAVGFMFRGWALSHMGQADIGLKDIQAARSKEQDVGMVFVTYHAMLKADAFRAAGMRHQAMETVQEGLTLVDRYKARAYQAKLLRLKGELLLPENREKAEAILSESEDLEQRKGAHAFCTR